MQTRGLIVTSTVIALILTSGCQCVQQGWKQELEIMNPFESAALGQQNENSTIPAYAHGAQQEFENYQPCESAERGIIADWEYWLSIRNQRLPRKGTGFEPLENPEL